MLTSTKEKEDQKVKRNKYLAVLMSGVMALSAVACGSKTETTDTSAGTTQTAETTADTQQTGDTAGGTVAAEPEVVEASVDFEDGNFAFARVCLTKGNPDNSELSVDTFGGSKALHITNVENKNMFVGINVDALLGSDVEKLARIVMDIGTEHSDGFHATSGKFYTYTGEKLTENKAGTWSVYLESANPNRLSFDVSGFVAGADNYILLTKETETSQTAGDLYIDNIAFYDAAGNLLTADSSADFGSPQGFENSGEDRSNLFGISGEVVMDLEGAGDAWSQIGYQAFTDEEWEALTTPGSVVEISYSSESGYMWMGLSGNNWLRIGVGDQDGSGQQYSYLNNSRNIAQITYEQIAAVCGDDTSAWDNAIFLESDSAFEVYSVKIGQQAANLIALNTVDLGIEGAGGAWSQIGYQELTEEQLEVLHSEDSVVVVEYSSEDGDLWIGLSGDNWMRVGVGDADGSGGVNAITDGSKCYVTYDMIASICGDDPSAWDKSIFIESDTDFEVYSVKVGHAAEFIPNNHQIDAGISGAGDAWSQIDYGITLSDEAVEALKTPGSVVNVSYASEGGECWIVMTSGDNGWVRVGVGDYDGSGQGYAVFDGSLCQVTHDMIAEWYGDDPETWGNQIVVEAASAFEVYGVTIGQSK